MRDFFAPAASVSLFFSFDVINTVLILILSRWIMRFWLSSVLLLFGFGILFTLPTVAQKAGSNLQLQQRSVVKTTFQVQHFGTLDGLPRKNIQALLEDQFGFLWIGTGNGLVRYDGYTFTPYYPRQGDSTSIGGRWITLLHEDARGAIWVGGWQWGMSWYDRQSNRFTSYRHDPSDSTSLMYEHVHAIQPSVNDPDIYWVAAHTPCIWDENKGGFGRFDRKTGKFTPVSLDNLHPASVSNHCVMTIAKDLNQTIWLGGWGLRRFDELSGTAQTFFPEPRYSTSPDLDSPFSLSNLLISISESKSEPGILWIGSARGLHRFDIEAESFTSYFPFPEDPGAEGNHISFFYEDRKGTFWAGIENTGLFTFDPQTRQFTRFPHQPRSPNIRTITEDRFGALWVGSENGLMKLVRRISPVNILGHYDQNSKIYNHRLVFIDRDGYLWSSRFNLLERRDRRTGAVNAFTINPDESTSPRAGYPMRVYQDRSGILWMASACTDATWGTLSRLNPGTGTIAHFQHDPDDIESLSRGCINGVLEDSRGRTWVYTWGGGFNRIDKEKGKFTRYAHKPGQPNSLIHDRILYMNENDAGVLWIGTEQGMSRFDPDTETFTNYTDDRLNRVMMLHEDAKGSIWVATASNGLLLFDPEQGQILRNWTIIDGLVNNVLWSIYEDHKGYFWMSSDQGISRFDSQAETFTNFTVQDGLPFDDFWEASHHQDTSGELFFGGPQGIFSFYPEDFDSDAVPPEIVVTDLRIEEVPASIGPDQPLKSSILQTKAVTLTHTQNDISFGYAALHSIEPSQNRHWYMLEGYDKDWVDAGSQRTARYPNLPPGDYAFRVKALSSEGVWSAEDARLKVTVLPPWWRTTPMFLVYGLMLLVGIYRVDRFQRRRLIEKEREKTRERELAQAREIEKAYTQLKATQQQLIHQEKMASLGQLTSGIAHEIKNPLNFVNNFAELNAELAKELDAELQANPDKRGAELREQVSDIIGSLKINALQIAKHGKRADEIVKSMMQHASGEGERYEVAINPLVDEMINITYSSLQSQKPDLEVNIEKNLDKSAGSLTISPQEIGRVLQNILGNALEAVHEKKLSVNGAYEPKLSVITRRENGQVEIRVTDNGPGIPHGALDKIFEPFFTTKPAGSGTGLGLSLSYDIVTQGHGGALEVKSQKGEGATFIVTLPD